MDYEQGSQQAENLLSPIPVVSEKLIVPHPAQAQKSSPHNSTRSMRLSSAPSLMNHTYTSSRHFSGVSTFHGIGHGEHLSSVTNFTTKTPETTYIETFQGTSSTPNTIKNLKLRAYSFDESIREFRPDKLYKDKDNKKRDSYKVRGVNLLNRDDIDGETAIRRLRKRREQHNRVERRRRDLINSSIEELSEIVPLAQLDGVKFARGNILRLTIDFIKELQQEVLSLKAENEELRRLTMSKAPLSDPTKCPPTIIINQPKDFSVNTGLASLSSESDIKTPADDQESSIGSRYPSQLTSPVSSPFPSPLDSPIYYTCESSMHLPLPEMTLTAVSPIPLSPTSSTGYTTSQLTYK